jgi:uncharacterized FAD-dependent dehydrogenase
MQQQISIRLLPSEAARDELILKAAAVSLAIPAGRITGYNILKRSIDARGKQPWINLTLVVLVDEPFIQRKPVTWQMKDVTKAPRSVVIAGAGPAGLFAALKLIELNIRPVILERGKDVRARRRDLALLNKEGIINPDSNYCFGEGGAGTYSDGKLYTRSSKRGDINRILGIFRQFGAEDNILYDAHPHIGTNKLPAIITAMREAIAHSGGQLHFESRITDLISRGDKIEGVKTQNGNGFSGDAVILATGHSARDIFEMLHRRNIAVFFKPFALGVRIEHPQELIDNIQYHQPERDPFLPPAAYSLVQQVDDKGVFSFCMCPGGIIAPAATNANELVVNGWSPSRRNNPFANSGMVVTVEENDVQHYKEHGALAGMHFQASVEKKAYAAGGGNFIAPAQRMTDFIEKRVSTSLPDCSYIPGLNSISLHEVLPDFIYGSLQNAFRIFGKKMKGYLTNEAVVVATESRTSSPVRIPRHPDSLRHPQFQNLYPCAEGAGYAGGIVSAAMDGERVAIKIAENILK